MTVLTLKNILNALPQDTPIAVYVTEGKEIRAPVFIGDIVSVECKQIGDNDPLQILLHVERD